jgi:hypothetical protein
VLKYLAMLATVNALAAISILAAAAQNSPTNAPEKGITESLGDTSGHPQKHAKQEDANAQNAPSVVVQVESPYKETECAQQGDGETERQLARYTFWLVVVGVLQALALAGTLWIVRRQAKIMDRQTGIMKAHGGHLENLASAADASSQNTEKTLLEIKRQADSMEAQAKLTERTIVLQFRPKVVVRVGQVKASNVAPLMEQATGTLEITLVNTGQTNAKVLQAQFEAIAVDFGASIGNTRIFDDSKNFTFDLVAGAFENFTIQLSGRVNDAIRWADDRLAGKVLGDATKGIYLVGFVVYMDDIGIKRQTGCFRNYSPPNKSFVPSENSDREFVD